MTVFVIGLTGAAGSGKSTVARHIVEKWGGDVRAFAEPLKAMLTTFLRYQGVDPDVCQRMVSGDLKEVPTEYLGGRTPREAMQTLGTEWGRSLSADLWVNAWRRRVYRDVEESMANKEDYILIADDVRFPNEVAAIRSRGDIVVHIGRPGVGLVGPSGQHASETEDLGAADMMIANTGDFSQLGMCADMVVAEVVTKGTKNPHSSSLIRSRTDIASLGIRR